MPANPPPSKQHRSEQRMAAAAAAAAAAGPHAGVAAGGHFYNYDNAWGSNTPSSAGLAPLQQYYG
jgi:hypothetical protein